jgi:hypothetical protein
MASANPDLNFAGKYMEASPSTGLGSVFGGEYANVRMFSDMPVEGLLTCCPRASWPG